MPITSYGVKGLLGAAMGSMTPASNNLASLAYRITSDLAAGQSELLDFIGAIPAVREWIGERKPGQLLAHDYKINMKKFEATLDFLRDWMDHDKTGLVQDRVNQLQVRLGQHVGKRVAALINAGETDTAFDGVAFFGNSHSWGESGTIDNLIGTQSASAGDPTPQEAATAVVDMFQQMFGFLDDRGEPINEGVSAITVAVPTALGAAYRQAINQDRLDTGSGTIDNPVKGLGVAVNLIVTPRITLSGKACAFNASPGAAPFVFAENPAARRITAKAEGSDYEHDTDRHQYGIRAITGDGYGLFTDAVLYNHN